MKSIILALAIIFTFSYAYPSLSIQINAGPDFWSDMTGYSSQVLMRLKTSEALPGLKDNHFFSGIGIGVSGVYAPGFNFMTYELGLTTGYTLFSGNIFNLEPSLFIGISADQRFNTIRGDVSIGFGMTPRLAIPFHLSPNISLGPGFGAKMHFNGQFTAVSFVASVDCNIHLVPNRKSQEQREIQSELQKLFDENHIPVELIKKGNNEIKLNMGDILFGTGKSQLQSGNLFVFKVVSEILQKYDSIYILIEGYTDNQGKEKDNLLLSESRARNVSDVLILNGFPTERIFYKGYGEKNPIVPNDSSANMALNRRVEIRIIWGNMTH